MSQYDKTDDSIVKTWKQKHTAKLFKSKSGKNLYWIETIWKSWTSFQSGHINYQKLKTGNFGQKNWEIYYTGYGNTQKSTMFDMDKIRLKLKQRQSLYSPNNYPPTGTSKALPGKLQSQFLVCNLILTKLDKI